VGRNRLVYYYGVSYSQVNGAADNFDVPRLDPKLDTDIVP
jgi:hypothetical protein